MFKLRLLTALCLVSLIGCEIKTEVHLADGSWAKREVPFWADTKMGELSVATQPFRLVVKNYDQQTEAMQTIRDGFDVAKSALSKAP